VSRFADAAELYDALHDVFRTADAHPVAGPALRSAGLVLRTDYTDPEASMTVILRQPQLRVVLGDSEQVPDLRLAMTGDQADAFWRGDLSIALAISRGEVALKGPVLWLVRVLPAASLLFPIYRERIGRRAVAEAPARLPQVSAR
jgi:hypothetical protein